MSAGGISGRIIPSSALLSASVASIVNGDSSALSRSQACSATPACYVYTPQGEEAAQTPRLLPGIDNTTCPIWRWFKPAQSPASPFLSARPCTATSASWGLKLLGGVSPHPLEAHPKPNSGGQRILLLHYPAP